MQAFLLAAHPTLQWHFTPTYSSWLNQVELWFAKTKQDIIARGIFTSTRDLARKLRRYIDPLQSGRRTVPMDPDR